MASARQVAAGAAVAKQKIKALLESEEVRRSQWAGSNDTAVSAEMDRAVAR